MKKKSKVYDEVLKVFNEAVVNRSGMKARWLKAKEEATSRIEKATATMEAMTDPDTYTAARAEKQTAEGEVEFYTKKLKALEEGGLMDQAQISQLREKLAKEAERIEKDADRDLRPRMDDVFNDALDYLAELTNIYELDYQLKENKDWVNYIPIYTRPDLFRALVKSFTTSGLYPGLPGELDRKWNDKLGAKQNNLKSI